MEGPVDSRLVAILKAHNETLRDVTDWSEWPYFTATAPRSLKVVIGPISWPFAVRCWDACFDQNCWIVTHLPSGFQIVQLASPSKERAQRAAEAVLFAVDWGSLTPMQAGPEALDKMMAALGDLHDEYLSTREGERE